MTYEELIEAYRRWTALQDTVTISEAHPFFYVREMTPRENAWREYCRVREMYEGRAKENG